mgnify:CR=1 FL=1
MLLKFRYFEKAQKIWKKYPNMFHITNELFIPFSFFVAFGRRIYKNVYLHFLKVFSVLPCKQKPSLKKSRNLCYKKQKTKYVMSRAIVLHEIYEMKNVQNLSKGLSAFTSGNGIE